MNVKDVKQSEALQAIKDNNGIGLIAMATGSGKSKIAINRVKELIKIKSNAKILIAVPTEKLRDVNWKEEFSKWKAKTIYSKNVERTCYVSMNKIKNKEYDLVILDEAHNITENNSQFFDNNKFKEGIALTATPPEDKEKSDLLIKYGFKTVYILALDEAVKLKLVSPYSITVIETRLDNSDKYIEAGNYKFTEKARYEFLTRTINSLMFKRNKTRNDEQNLRFRTFDRMRFIYKLKSKESAAKFLLDKIIPKNERTLIFCGGIEQSIALCKNRFFSKPSYKKGNKKSEKRAKELSKFWKKDEDFNLFREEKINRLSCIDALNEGHNIPNVDNALIVQVNSKEKDLIQRIGRIVRFREGHEGKIWIIVCVDSVDEKWLKKALSTFDDTKIEYIRLINLINKHGKKI